MKRAVGLHLAHFISAQGREVQDGTQKTNEEHLAWYVGFIHLLEPILASAQLSFQEWAKELLARNFRGLWSFAGCYESLENIIDEHGRDGNWIGIWLAIKETIAFDKDQCTPELLARLESLNNLTAPFDLCSNIEAYALVNSWDHINSNDKNLSEKTDYIHEKVIRLGELAASQLFFLDHLGVKLWHTHAEPLVSLGKGLAIGSTDKFSMFDSLIESFQTHHSNQANILLLQGYIRGVYDSDPQHGRQILERALATPELKFEAVKLILIFPIASWTLLKLMNFARGGELNAWNFEQISYGRIHEAIPDEKLADLLTEINKLDCGYISTIRIISMRFLEKEQTAYKPNAKLCAVARASILRLVSAPREEGGKAQFHRLNSVLEEAFNKSTPDSEIKEVINSLCAGVKEYRLSTSDLTEVIKFLVKKYSALLLDTVFDGSDKEEILHPHCSRTECIWKEEF